jgi:hypothetical protein
VSAEIVPIESHPKYRPHFVALSDDKLEDAIVAHVAAYPRMSKTRVLAGTLDYLDLADDKDLEHSGWRAISRLVSEGRLRVNQVGVAHLLHIPQAKAT